MARTLDRPVNTGARLTPCLVLKVARVIALSANAIVSFVRAIEGPRGRPGKRKPF
jgi:hypothetical protein